MTTKKPRGSYVRFRVRSADLAQKRPGDAIQITANGYAVPGTILRIAPALDKTEIELEVLVGGARVGLAGKNGEDLSWDEWVPTS